MEQKGKEQAAPQQGTDIEKIDDNTQGRKPENASPEKPEDISQVDQQEGEMNNGELGGNLDAAAIE